MSMVRETGDELMIEIDESDKRLHLLLASRSGPVYHSSDLDQIHFNLIVRDDDPQILNLSFFELTFLGSKIELVFAHPIQDQSSNAVMFFD
jgi:hypothetical protein